MGLPVLPCQLDPPFPLPTTLSGFTGNWSGPGVSNNIFSPAGLNGVITLVFTPDPGQCASLASSLVVVLNPSTPTLSGVPANVCSDASPISLPTTQSGVVGNWSGPGVSNNTFDPAGLDGSVTLTFTPNPGPCVNSNTITVTVGLALPPTISGVPASLCENNSPVTLPTTQSGVTGTWSGPGVSGTSFNPTGLSGSITLTFTPDSGQCAIPATTSIQVNTPVTPVISGVPGTLCALDPPAALPATQSGINGSWSGPGVSGNTLNPNGLSGTITLTFTPNAGQCANPATASVDITPASTPIISGLPAVLCQLDPAIPLPTTLSGLNGNWSGPGVSANTFNPSGLSGNITLTFTPFPGQCANAASTQILVNAASAPTLSGVPASFCTADPPTALPTTQSGITGNWSGPGVSGNTFNPSGLNGSVTLTFTPDPGQCANPNSLTVSVTPIAPPTISGVPASICQNEPPLVLNAVQSGIPGSWSGQGVSNNVFNPSGLLGNIPLTFTPNPGQCALPATASITVIQEVNPVLSGLPASVCSLDPPIGLSSIQSGIQGSWSGPGVSGNTFNPSGLGGPVTLVFTPNPGQCANPASAIINVSPAQTPVLSGLPATVCETDPPLGLSAVQSGIPGSWSGPGVTGNTFNPNGLNGLITLTFTPNSGLCASAATASITVLPSVTPAISGIPPAFCETDTPIALPALLSGIVGTWSGPGVAGNNFSPAGLSGSITLQFTPNPGQCAQANSTTVNVFTAPFVVDVMETCDLSTQTYTVSFTIQGGQAGTYTVNGIPVGGNSFSSAPIASNVPYAFTVSDINACAPSTITGIRSCDCPTFAGTMNFSASPVLVCPGDGFSVVHNSNEALEPGDVLVFILHSNPGNILGDILDTSPNTSFPAQPGAIPGTTYYVSAVAGTEAGNGLPDLNDPCLSVSPGVPVLFLEEAIGELQSTICPADSLVVNGTVYNISNPSGTEFFPGGSNNGCDSTLTISLSFFPEAVNSISSTLCPGESITVGSEVFDQSNPLGTVVLPGASMQGCDSTVTVNLSFFPLASDTLNLTLCPGESVTVQGTVYDESNPSGTELFAGSGANGCDSTLVVQLQFFEPAVETMNQTLCLGSSILVNGVVYDESNPSGTEIIFNGSAEGCDSTIVVNLTFVSEVMEDLSLLLCPGESILVNGTVYDENNPSGTELFAGGSANGCDSLLTVQLQFFAPAAETIEQTLCPGESILVNSVLYDENNPAGTEIIFNGSSNGCDSTITVSLSFFPEASGSLNLTLCPGESVTIQGTVYDESNPSGTELFVGGGANGCDSTLAINLSFFPEAFGILDTLLAAGQSLQIQGTTYDFQNSEGIEIFPGASTQGCDSILFITLRFETQFEVFFDLSTPSCPGERDGAIHISEPEGGLSPFVVFLNGLQVAVTDSFPVSLTGLASDTYSVQIVDASGVEREWMIFLEDPPPLLVLLPEEVRLSLGEQVSLQAQATVSVEQWQWSPPSFLSCVDCPNPTVVRPSENILYTVIATDENGCTGFAQVQLILERLRRVYIPNVFSPNDDGFNDAFGIFAGPEVAQVHSFRVFSRWGELLHEALSFQPDPNDGRAGSWDGRFRGQPMNPGVYVWYVDLEFLDGRREIRSGDVTLLR